MPRNLPHFTTCATPEVARQYDFPVVLTVILGAGVVGPFVAIIAGGGCSPYTIAAVALEALIIVAALAEFENWFYNERLMCLKSNQCAIGTLVGEPTTGCDGDRKLDLLLSPFGFHEVDRDLMSDVVTQLAGTTVDGQTFPPAGPNDVSTHSQRVNWVEGLPDPQRRLLYLELVQNHMLNQQARAFQSRFYHKEGQAASPDQQLSQDQLAHIPDDNAGLTSSNPMFRYDGDGVDDVPLVKRFFCWLVGKLPDEPTFGEHRLVPYFHCEIEGDLVHRGVFNLRIAILGFAAAYGALCAICDTVTLGVGTYICGWLAALGAYLFSWWIWFFLSLFGDNLDEGDAGSTSEVPLPLPNQYPDGNDDSVSNRGDVILVYGDWVKDTEHTEWFEIHPVKAWYLITLDPDGGPGLQDDPNMPTESFDTRRISKDLRDEMCQMVSHSESIEPLSVNTQTTAAALSVALGLAA